MSEQTARLVARLRDRLHRTTRRMTWAELAFGTAVAVGSVAAVWFVATLLEASLWLGTAARTALAAAVGTVTIGIAAAMLARPLARLAGIASGPSDQDVARKVGRHHPQVADRLVNLLQLAEGERSHSPAPFVDEAVQHLAQDLDDVSFREVEDFGRARQALRLASLPLAAILAFLLVAPSTFLGASQRLLAPNTTFDRPAPFELSVAPGAARLVRGDSLHITVRSSGQTPSTAHLYRRDDAESTPKRIPLRSDSSGTFSYTVASVRSSFEYRVAAPPVRSQWFEVVVESRPLVRRVQVEVTPPAYTGLPSRRLEPNVGDISALPGSRVSVSATVGGPEVETAELVFPDRSPQSLHLKKRTASGSFTLLRDGPYHIRLKSTAGPTNRDPIRYQKSLQQDARPSVSFESPRGPTDISDDLTQELRVRLSDDFGFSRVRLFYRISDERFGSGADEYSSIRLSLPNQGQTNQELVHDWLLAQESGLEPEPGDVISYYVKAWDNDTVNGPKSGRTDTQRLRMPSVAEQYEQLDETQSEAEQQMDRLRQRSDSVRQQFQQLRQELRRTREADWQDQRQVEQLQNKQESLDRGVEELSRKVQEMNRQMQKNGLSSSEMSQQFEELERVIDEIKSPELQKALEQLRKAMQSNDMRQMQRAMEKVSESEESYREQLERTLSLFKNLKAQQKLQELARRAGELSQRQRTLREKTRERMESSPDSASGTKARDRSPSESDSTATNNSSSRKESTEEKDETSESPDANRSKRNQEGKDRAAEEEAPRAKPDRNRESLDQGPSNEDLASEQKQAAEEMRKLEKAMEKAQQDMEDVQSAPRKQLQKMNRQLQQQDLPQKMEKNSQQLRDKQMRDAQKGQQRLEQSLSQMQKQLTQMKNQMQGQQRQINLTGLRSALENTLRLSKRQESLRTNIDNLATEGPTVRSYARDQKILADGLRTVTDSLQSIAERVPQMSNQVRQKSGNALRAMETATTALDERNAQKATGHQKTSMMHLNELAILLSNLLEQLQNQQGSGSGMSMQQMVQKLQQMSGQQQKLNQQIQDFLNNVQGERLSSDQAERRKELARQQRQIKKQLEETGVGSEVRQQVLGDLEKIAEQMEDSAQELERGQRPSRELIKRQRQILTRLLNAQKSLRTQGKQKQRQDREASDDIEQKQPGQLPATEDADQLRRDLIRALEMGYSSDYEELIQRYFELLRERRTGSGSQ